jgi:DNA-binding Lrp family transcriptional regulator
MEPDLLDRKILAQLDIDSRQSSRDIARRVGSNKDTVNYRIRRLIDDKVVSGFTTHVDTARFGFSNIKTYVRFQDTDEEKEAEFFAYLSSLPEVGWVARSSGRWDALFCTWAPSSFAFYKTLSKILDRFSRNIYEKEIIHNINWFYYSRKWLLPENPSVHAVKYGEEPGKSPISASDYSILRELVPNSRKSFSDVAKAAGLSPQKVFNRVSAMRKKGIITKFGMDLDYGTLGIVFMKTFISLHNIDKKSLESICRFCGREPRVFALTTALGAWDLELEMEVRRVEDAMDVMNRLKRAFPDFVKGYDSIVITKQSGLNYLPPRP